MLPIEDLGGLACAQCLRSFDELVSKLGKRYVWRATDAVALAAFVKTVLKS